jgi:hypothetical protein
MVNAKKCDINRSPILNAPGLPLAWLFFTREFCRTVLLPFYLLDSPPSDLMALGFCRVVYQPDIAKYLYRLC